MLTHEWRKATQSDTQGACVYVRLSEDGFVEVRDGKLADASPILRFTPREWNSYLDGIRKGGFDLP
jgi:hypothetical protein